LSICKEFRHYYRLFLSAAINRKFKMKKISMLWFNWVATASVRNI